LKVLSVNKGHIDLQGDYSFFLPKVQDEARRQNRNQVLQLLTSGDKVTSVYLRKRGSIKSDINKCASFVIPAKLVLGKAGSGNPENRLDSGAGPILDSGSSPE
jgi:hypothetical protein